ncbi:hypothetical protein OG785_21105 [Streptomyces sp. NBC_00006]|uniref:hypothetical protein n=1 Tax=unclassified Streptomyces TaxID=2593676 RepID=UPI00224DF781|nr:MULTISPECIES: hypothetical protein [unclassified Streptomyces]MCX4827546.1 hypothetical protein [Streptomyces sp. NBC_01016]MCX5533044.1 hypothetical protein [Streptomyces sp. NBC_00006]
MSEFAVSKTAIGAQTPPVPNRSAATSIVHESYSFACMRCGHGWEQSYEIEHHVDGEGAEFVMYVVGGERVPSPLTRPTCVNCEGHVVRIMRAGRVSSARDALQHHRTPQSGPVDVPEPGAAEREGHHHWHLSDLLHPFSHHHKRDE